MQNTEHFFFLWKYEKFSLNTDQIKTKFLSLLLRTEIDSKSNLGILENFLRSSNILSIYCFFHTNIYRVMLEWFSQ